jgi:hypothetical protein
MFNNRVQKKTVNSVVPVKQHAGRERLKHFDVEVSKAKEAITDLEQRVERLQHIISDAAEAHHALQMEIVSDGGVELANYSAGRAAPDSDISKLVLSAENSARAATAAKAALPKAEADLENARSQVVDLNDQRVTELNNVIASLGAVEAQRYEDAFNKLCILHDRLVGYCEINEMNAGDVRRIIDPLRTPRFALGSMGGSESDPFLRHLSPSSITVGESSRKWSEIRSRLEVDVNADISDLETKQ